MPILDLSVDFLSGTFHGEAWPPAPARLYQALLAGTRYRYRRGAEWKKEFEEALRWLEVQPAPTIVAPPATEGTHYRIFGPDNDMDLVVNEWINTSVGKPPREPLDPTSLRSGIARRPWYVRGTVHYLYPDEGAPVETLREMAHSIVALGHGIDLACGRLSVFAENGASAIRGERWTPAADAGEGSVGLYSPTKGWYDRLEANYQQWRLAPSHGGVDVRKGSVPPSVRPVPYRSSTAPLPRPFLAYTLKGSDDQQPYSVSWESGMEIAARLRHATSEALRSDGVEESIIRVYALGHGNGPERDRRLSYLPLPSIGHPHADGRVRRAILTGEADDRHLQDLAPILDGMPLVAPGKPPARLVALTGRDAVLDRYLGPSRSWASVTPVILHGHDAKRGRVNANKTHSLIQEAIVQAGLGRAIASYSYRPAPWWPGTGSSRDLRTPAHLATWPRYHLKIRFHTTVRGPLVIGIGRHYGLGLLASLDAPASARTDE
jgi:CRISPR-associated protein Csb2